MDQAIRAAQETNKETQPLSHTTLESVKICQFPSIVPYIYNI